MKYKAVFFDRDGTLTYFTPEAGDRRDSIISRAIGREFHLTNDLYCDVFDKTKEKYPEFSAPQTMADESRFYYYWFITLLSGEGLTDNIEDTARALCDDLWVHDRTLYPETLEVLEYFRSHGYKMGVISDTGITLEETLNVVGIGKYFTSFTSSASAGAVKPSPEIFNSALTLQNVSASESIFVDDLSHLADGARELGFCAFTVDRGGECSDKWHIKDLKGLIDYVKVTEK